jgi:hypothetical protein
MSFVLPDFKDHKCLEVTCCGFISADGFAKNQHAMTPVERNMIARFVTHTGQECFVRLVTPFPWELEDDGGRIHIHLVVSRPEALKKPPKTNCEIGDILSRLSPFLGKEANVHLSGRFELPGFGLPPVIRLLSIETMVKGLRVRFTGGRLSVEGAPIDTISWKLPEKGGKGTVTLEAKKRLPLDEGYLVKALGVLEETFAAFVDGEN